jgi:transcriptional regulator with PAS, ATPase and Fis domain
MAKGKERTLTAVRSPLARAEEATVPVLFACGRASAAAMAPRFIILGDELLLGRLSDGEEAHTTGALRLPDPLVSGRHARLVLRGREGVDLEDLGSKNGTFVGARRLTGREALADGTLFFLGGHGFVFRMVSALALEAIQEEGATPFGPVPTASPTMALVVQKLRRWARGDNEILITGETGVGKEVYARAVHAASGRQSGFVALNCAALPRELVESELFGYRPGAHSTARVSKAGLLEQADGGTLFLDEIGEMPQEAQVKLLRFLQDREVVPLGGTRPRRLDVRVLAATNRAVGPNQAGGLRDDLLGRLGAAPVTLPPLRERLEDLGVLIAHLLARGASRAVPGFEGPAFRTLFLHRWPLNVRELEKVLAAAAALTGGGRPIALRDLPPAVAGALQAPAAPAAAPPPAADERPTGRKPPEPGPSPEELEALLVQHKGDVADVSRALGRQRAAVWRWIKRFGLGPEKYRDKP